MTTQGDEGTTENQVFLRGRLAATAIDKDLPSGDVLTVFRLTVDRPAGERVRVDSLECETTRARARRSLARAEVGDLIEVAGSLRRRFWRSPNGPASRYAVDATTVRVIRPGRRAAASRDPKPASA